MEKLLVQKLKNAWRNCNAATVGFAKTVPANKWSQKPFDPRFRSFAWEFTCLLRTRVCYLKALKTGQLIFGHQTDIPSKDLLQKENKPAIIKKLEETVREILQEIEKIDSLEKVNRIIWLLQHERLHHGKLLLYCANLDLKLPVSFTKTWGESNFPSHVL